VDNHRDCAVMIEIKNKGVNMSHDDALEKDQYELDFGQSASRTELIQQGVDEFWEKWGKSGVFP